jgi:hypothetical protein
VIAAIIAGQAYGHRATLELSQDTLTWRAHRGSLQKTAENIVTTVHDVRDVRWIEQSWSLPGGVLAILGLVWIFTEGVLWGAIALAAAVAMLVRRRVRPRLYLSLDLGARQLVMKVTVASAADARSLVERIERALATGELPATPPALP